MIGLHDQRWSRLAGIALQRDGDEIAALHLSVGGVPGLLGERAPSWGLPPTRPIAGIAGPPLRRTLVRWCSTPRSAPGEGRHARRLLRRCLTRSAVLFGGVVRVSMRVTCSIYPCPSPASASRPPPRHPKPRPARTLRTSHTL